MINQNIYSKLSINIILILSFLLSISLSFHYLSKYDKLIKIENTDELIHPMLKSAVGNHWSEADEIINDITEAIKKKWLIVANTKTNKNNLDPSCPLWHNNCYKIVD